MRDTYHIQNSTLLYIPLILGLHNIVGVLIDLTEDVELIWYNIATPVTAYINVCNRWVLT